MLVFVVRFNTMLIRYQN